MPLLPPEAVIQREDQLGLSLCEELQDRAGEVKIAFAEGRLPEAYTALQEAENTITELRKGFTLMGGVSETEAVALHYTPVTDVQHCMCPEPKHIHDETIFEFNPSCPFHGHFA